MKNISKAVMIMVAALFVSGLGVALAGIVNSEHDMFDGGYGTEPNVCSYCHVPHNAVGEKIWSSWANEAQLVSGPSSPIGNMCFTCHDGTVTNRGQSTVFNTSLQQHKTGSGTDCNICHTVHDNTNGKFLGIVKTQSALTESSTYCETCHDATMHPGAEVHGDHLGGVEHPFKDAGPILDESCNSCHQMHGAVNYSTPELTNPILKVNNTDSAYCAICHLDHVQNANGGSKHPANLNASGTWGKMSCATCHDVHQPDASNHPAILTDTNADSAFCMTCHQASGGVNGPSIGSHTHPTGESFNTIGLTPSAVDIDDNDNGPDYSGNTAVIACESCHSIHSKGAASPLLRITDTAGSLCVNCHQNK